MEVILTQFIKLWELWNKEVHGKTAEQQERIQKLKLSEEVKRLNVMKDDTRHSDMFLVHHRMEYFIEQ